eukprot:491784_1
MEQLLWQLCCNKAPKELTTNGKQGKPVEPWKPCVPKEFLYIWLIVTVILVSGIHYMSKSPYNPSQATINSNSMDLNNKLSDYIHKDYALLHQSAKSLIFIHVINMEDTTHHFFTLWFNHWIRQDTAHYRSLSAPLLTLMQDCFKHDHPLRKTHTIDASCDEVQQKFNELSTRLPDNSVLLHSAKQYSNIIKLVHWTQNTTPYPFDLRLIVLKRHQWSTTLRSVITGYCHKLRRIRFFKKLLSRIHMDLSRVDAQFWIMIEFDHFQRNAVEYGPLLVQYMFGNMDAKDHMLTQLTWSLKFTLQKALATGQVSDHDKIKDSNCTTLTSKQLTDTIQYLRMDSVDEWPLFNENKFVVMPNHTAFLT